MWMNTTTELHAQPMKMAYKKECKLTATWRRGGGVIKGVCGAGEKAQRVKSLSGKHWGCLGILRTVYTSTEQHMHMW
jgi:hypothetical protein